MKHAAALIAITLILIPGATALERPGFVRVTVKQLYTQTTTAGRLSVVSIYNRSLTPNAIGNGQRLCIDIGGRGRGPLPADASYCFGSYSIGTGGSINVHGVARSRTYYQLSIVGGTGIYDNVGGTLTVIRYASRPVRERLVFNLTYP